MVTSVAQHPTQLNNHIFVSHSSRDQDFVVHRLKPALEAAGFVAWCSSTDLRAAANWELQIRAALSRSGWFVVVMSPDAARSEWVRAETHWAIENIPGRVVPILARDCRPIDLHLRLGTLQFIDFRGDFDAAMQQMLGVIGCDDEGTIGGASGPCGAWDGMEPTRIMTHSRSATLTISVARVAASTYEERLNVHNSATIGRAPQAHLRLDDDCVSRRHARLDVLTVEPSVTMTLMDLDSANGTYLNDDRIDGPRAIQSGDTIGIGGCKLHILEIRRAS